VLQQQVLENTDKRRRGRSLVLAAAAEIRFECLERRRLQRRVVNRPDRELTAKLLSAIFQVADLWAVVRRLVERQVRDLPIRNRQAEALAEMLNRLDSHFLLLVGRVAALAGFAKPVALNRLGQNHGRRAAVLNGRLIGRINLYRVMATAAESAKR